MHNAPDPKDEGASSLAAAPKSTAGRRQSQTWHAVARVERVTARTGRERWLLIYRCPYCRARHASHVRELTPSCTRKAACGHGRLELLLAVDLEAA